MRELNYTTLFPREGSVAIYGRRMEEDLLRALGYAQAEGSNNPFIPITASQYVKAKELGLRIASGYPDYLFLEVDRYEGGNAVAGRVDSPLLMRLYEMVSDRVILLETRYYHTITVEYIPTVFHHVEPMILLYGDIVERKKNALGHYVAEVIPTESNLDFLREKLREIPGVVEVSIVPTLPFRRIEVWREL